MNGRMIEASLGMLARLIPPDIYAKVGADLNELVQLARTLDERVKRIEAATVGLGDLADRLAFMETIVRNGTPDAGAAFGERDMYMVPGTIEQALAPARRKANDG